MHSVIDDCFVMHEDFIAMHSLGRATAEQVVAVRKNALRAPRAPIAPLDSVMMEQRRWQARKLE